MDKNAKRILKYFNKERIKTTSSVVASELNMDLDDVENSVNDLLEYEFLKICYSDMTYTMYTSTAKGFNYFKTNNKELFFKYLYPILTALISFVLGLIANLLMK